MIYQKLHIHFALLENESKFDFYYAYLIAFGQLKKKLASSLIIISLDWGE